VLTSYVATAVLLTWRFWAHPTVMVPDNGGDIYLNMWFMRYVATALAHGHLPALITAQMNAPQGLNLMWNTSLLLPDLVLAPVTWLAGPVASLCVLLTLGFAGSAAAMFWVLRRWDVAAGPAAIGGAFYAFMPALMTAAEDHYHLEFAVLPPLIIDAAARLAVGRGHPVRTGAWLGLLISVQIFIAEELLVDTAIAAAVLVLVLALARPRAIPNRVAEAIVGAGAAAAVVVVLCGYALWRQFLGPLTEHGTPWDTYKYGNHLASFVTPPYTTLLTNSATYTQFLVRTGQYPTEAYGYLGWPLAIALIVIPIVFWRDVRIRVTGLSFLALEWLSMGPHGQRAFGLLVPGWAFPWHYLTHAPLLQEVVITRLSIISDGMGAFTLALAAAKIITAVLDSEAWRRPAYASAAVLALAVIAVPLIPRPVPAVAVSQPPTGWRAVLGELHLPPDAIVLTLPLDGAQVTAWQALTGTPISVVGGECVVPDAAGKATQCQTKQVQTRVQSTTVLRMGWLSRTPGAPGPSFSTTEQAFRQWQAAAVLVTPGFDAGLTRYLTAFLGPPTVQQDGILGWRLGKNWYLHLDWHGQQTYPPTQAVPAARPRT
jgi:hypothetical protein